MTAAAIVIAVALALGSAQSGQGAGCSTQPVRPGGQFVESKFFDAAPQRTREALEDAMQAVGVLLFESSPAVIRGERAGPRVRALHVPAGDEAVFGFLEAAERDGKAGTLVRIETRRRGGKNGEPKQSWSSAVLDEAACLLSTLGMEDPSARAGATASEADAGQPLEVRVPADTAVTLVLRRFVFSSDLRINQKVLFEVASDVSVGPDIVIRRGALGVARVKATEDAAGSKSAKARMEFEFVSTVSGDRIPVRGVASLVGETGGFPSLAWGIGQEFAMCAGTRFDVTVDGEQRVRVAPR
jgi:hypothetical protein